MLIKTRDQVEHAGWQLSDVRYRPGAAGHPEMVEPEVAGVPVSVWAANTLPHVLAFVEGMIACSASTILAGRKSNCRGTIAYCVQRGLGPDGALADIPEGERDPKNARRFFYAVPRLQPEARVWQLVYSEEGCPH